MWKESTASAAGKNKPPFRPRAGYGCYVSETLDEARDPDPDTRPEATDVSGFVSATYQMAWDGERRVLGLGAARGWLGDAAVDAVVDRTTQLEAYLRFRFRNRFDVTPSVQWIDGGALGASRGRELVFSVRLHRPFSWSSAGRHPGE